MGGLHERRRRYASYGPVIPIWQEEVPYWCGFIITASWATYVNYGDSRLIERYYPYMQKWLEYVDKYTVNGLLKTWPNTDYRNWYLGDWATPTGIDRTNPLSVDVVDNCYISVCYQTMCKIANVLGKETG